MGLGLAPERMPHWAEMTKRLTRTRAGTEMVLLLLLAPGSSMPKLKLMKPQEGHCGFDWGW